MTKQEMYKELLEITTNLVYLNLNDDAVGGLRDGYWKFEISPTVTIEVNNNIYMALKNIVKNSFQNRIAELEAQLKKEL